jgi:hypothetical protein
MHISEVIRGWLGWCPNAHAELRKVVIRPDDETVTPSGSGRFNPGGMNIDPVVKSELARSIGVFYLSLVFFCILFVTGILDSLPGYAPFLMSFLTTGIIFLVLVWFRKNHPTVKIPTHFSHLARLEGILSVLIIFAIYMSVSVLYPISGILWPVILLVIGIFLVNISFKDGENYQVNLPRWLFFYIFVASLIVIHDLVLGNTTQSNIIFIAILGVISMVIVLVHNKVSGGIHEKNTG